jgi:hypothetical protein
MGSVELLFGLQKNGYCARFFFILGAMNGLGVLDYSF